MSQSQIRPGWYELVLGDRKLEVEADVDHYPHGAKRLGREHPEAVVGVLDVAELVHEPLGVEGPAFPVARVRPQLALEGAEALLERHAEPDLQVVAGHPLVIRHRDLRPEWKPRPTLGGIPRASGAAEVRRGCGVVHRSRSPGRRFTALDPAYLLRDVEVGPVEIGDGPIGQLLQVGEQLVDAFDAPGRVILQHLPGAVDTRAGRDLLGGRGHLGFDAVQLIPAPGVDLLGIAVHTEPPANPDGVQLTADRVRFGGLWRVLVAQESSHGGICIGGYPGALAEPLPERIVVR